MPIMQGEDRVEAGECRAVGETGCVLAEQWAEPAGVVPASWGLATAFGYWRRLPTGDAMLPVVVQAGDEVASVEVVLVDATGRAFFEVGRVRSFIRGAGCLLSLSCWLMGVSRCCLQS